MQLYSRGNVKQLLPLLLIRAHEGPRQVTDFARNYRAFIRPPTRTSLGYLDVG